MSNPRIPYQMASDRKALPPPVAGKKLIVLSSMQYLHMTRVILDDSALRARLPGLRKTPYDAGIRLTLEAMRM
jgi:hypothetical protein